MTIIIVGVAMLALMALTRLPLGFNMLLCGIGGIAALHPRGLDAGLSVAEQAVMELAMNFQFSVLPLFLAMGVFVTKAGLADDLFNAADVWFSRFRGGVAMASILACAGFASLSHNSAASTATMSRIAVPAMSRLRYDQGLAAGTVAAGGTMGILIPPSGALIIYGMLTETSLGSLFMAALIPAVIQLACYLLVVVALVQLVPGWLPRSHSSVTWAERIKALGSVWGVLLLFGMIVCGIFFGIFTTTEAGGIGAGGALAFACWRRRMSWQRFTEALKEALTTASMIYVVAAGAMVINQFVNISGLPERTMAGIQALHLEPMAVVALLLLCYVVLGMFIDGFAMIFLTVPVVAPVIVSLGLDPIWWGIVLIIVVEMAMISPPVGLNVFIMKAMVPSLSLRSIYKGVIPFMVSDVVRLVAIAVFPGLALWLPSIMR
ncbi:Sialic acid TRAP transporter permease protein SiaT [Pigmentiphaga humi]|uniref:Sialic acid TRAP transporter permease protein SiaT n=1 Tax=Pigmentiphaga humi TaxID=2478468 RepID=A0A3P4B3C1_9BURK|nr:TRAP transporter large permease [Pigmentiphaga humi]VCU70411.1 Sialic acid TRAP transporter permease protein SiaT [Pigmentiphaga humi]